MKGLTAKEVATTQIKKLRVQRRVRIANVATLVMDLHDNDFRALLIESHQIDSHFYQRIVIDKAELNHEDMMKLVNIAEIHDAKISLFTLRLNQQEASRLAIWPSGD